MRFTSHGKSFATVDNRVIVDTLGAEPMSRDWIQWLQRKYAMVQWRFTVPIQ